MSERCKEPLHIQAIINNQCSSLLWSFFSLIIQNICWHSFFVLPVTILLALRISYVFLKQLLWELSAQWTASFSDNNAQKLSSQQRQACEHCHPNWLKEAKDIWFLGCGKKAHLKTISFCLHSSWCSQCIDKNKGYTGFGCDSCASIFCIRRGVREQQCILMCSQCLCLNPINSVCSRDTSLYLVRES